MGPNDLRVHVACWCRGAGQVMQMPMNAAETEADLVSA